MFLVFFHLFSPRISSDPRVTIFCHFGLVGVWPHAPGPLLSAEFPSSFPPSVSFVVSSFAPCVSFIHRYAPQRLLTFRPLRRRRRRRRRRRLLLTSSVWWSSNRFRAALNDTWYSLSRAASPATTLFCSRPDRRRRRRHESRSVNEWLRGHHSLHDIPLPVSQVGSRR